jgi:hypothetical protein
VKTAKDYSVSKTLYIYWSFKMPLLLLLIIFQENKSNDFSISIVTTHGKLYGKWSRIENCFEKEFNQVWAKANEVKSAIKKHEHSSVSGSSSEEDDSAMIKYRI